MKDQPWQSIHDQEATAVKAVIFKICQIKTAFYFCRSLNCPFLVATLAAFSCLPLVLSLVLSLLLPLSVAFVCCLCLLSLFVVPHIATLAGSQSQVVAIIALHCYPHRVLCYKHKVLLQTSLPCCWWPSQKSVKLFRVAEKEFQDG